MKPRPLAFACLAVAFALSVVPEVHAQFWLANSVNDPVPRQAN